MVRIYLAGQGIHHGMNCVHNYLLMYTMSAYFLLRLIASPYIPSSEDHEDDRRHEKHLSLH